jgi:hypothetical protein
MFEGIRRSILFSALFKGDQKAEVRFNKATGATAIGSCGNHVDEVETARKRAKQQRHVPGLGLWAAFGLIGLAIVSLALGLGIDPTISIFASP